MPRGLLHLSPAGRGRIPSGAQRSEGIRVRGEPPIESHLPPHPNPLPDGERECAEFSISSVLNPQSIGSKSAASRWEPAPRRRISGV